tara:strand:+ start:1511 stop:2077 length:567 start_codon:yes stop_codon:yes gene_type:complete
MKILLEAKPDFFKSQISLILFVHLPLLLFTLWAFSMNSTVGIWSFLLLQVLFILPHYLHITSFLITVTETHTTFTSGIIGKRKVEVEHSKVTRIDTSQGVFNTMFNIGKINIFTTGDMSEFACTAIAEFNQIKSLIDDRRSSVKTENSSNENNNDFSAKIKKLKSMLDDGLLTEEEYNKKKDDILDKI